MTKPELTKKMQEKLPCGHTGEEHLAATLIVAACQALNMPFNVMIAACQIITERSHEVSAEPNTFVAPMGNA